jgi:hypothetical protein
MIHEAFNDAHCDRALFTFLDSLLDYKRLDQSDSDTIMRIMMILTGLWQRLSGLELDPRVSHCLELISYLWSTISRFTKILHESNTAALKHLVASAVHELPHLNRTDVRRPRARWLANLARTKVRRIQSASADTKRQMKIFEQHLSWSRILVDSPS